jgi:nucleotide-binding universal stress UspA family protein
MIAIGLDPDVVVRTVTSASVVVGIDGSPSSQAALRWAAHLARSTYWGLRAVHVLEWPIGLEDSASMSGPGQVLQLRDSAVEPAYRRGMTRVFDEVRPCPEWQLHFAEGDLAQVLVELSDKAELLVIGSREHAAAGRTLAGGISHYCISHAKCPVVIVPVEYLERPSSLELSGQRRTA